MCDGRAKIKKCMLFRIHCIWQNKLISALMLNTFTLSYLFSTIGSCSTWGDCYVCVPRLFTNDWVQHHHNSLPDHGFRDTKPLWMSILSNKSCKASSLRSSEWASMVKHHRDSYLGSILIWASCVKRHRLTPDADPRCERGPYIDSLYIRVATAQGKRWIWMLTFPDRENTGI